MDGITPIMKMRIRQFTALSHLTVLEASRSPLTLLLTVAGLTLTALTPLLFLYNLGEEGKMARDTGLACQFVFGLLLATTLAASSVSHERQSGTAGAVLSKPVSRETFFLAKFVGLAAVLIIFSVSTGLSTLLAERVSEKFTTTGRLSGHIVDWPTGILLLAAPYLAMIPAAWLNYTGRKSFQSVAFILIPPTLLAILLFRGFFDRSGSPAPFDLQVQWRILPAALLLCAALLMLMALALALSTRFAPVPTAVVCSILFVLGLLADYLLGQTAEHSIAARFLYNLLPNWQHFWMVDSLDSGAVIRGPYLGRALVYAVAWTGGILTLGAFSFRHMEVR